MSSCETCAAERRLASTLAAKLKRPYSEMVNWVCHRMCIANMQQATLLLQESGVSHQYGGQGIA
ncbi:hypothetical protein ACHAXS_004271 [Conticribra weissflogii]